MARTSKIVNSVDVKQDEGAKFASQNVGAKFTSPKEEGRDSEILNSIKEAGTYKDFIFLSIKDLLGDKVHKKPTEIFEFPPYKVDVDAKKQKELFNDIDYDSADFDKLNELDLNVDTDTNTINSNINKEYPNQQLTIEKPKYSVTEIKQSKHDKGQFFENKAITYQDADSEDEALNEDKTSDIVRMDGSELGTLLHSFMEHYDFETDVTEFIASVGAKQCEPTTVAAVSDRHVRANACRARMDNKYAKLSAYVSNINAFLSSDLGKALKTANQNNKLYREQRFMIEMPLATVKQYMNDAAAQQDVETNQAVGADFIRPSRCEVHEHANVGAKFTSPQIIVQGVIDAFYINDNGNIILIDYKTDGLSNGKITKDQLINNYKIQMDIYEKALNQITGKKVEQRYIYSFALNEAIII